MDALSERPGDLAALALFLLVWVAYEPILRILARGKHLINADMVVVRRAWMVQMVGRQGGLRLLDSQLVGHALNSASFFASSNLILIAGAAGVLFGGEGAWRRLEAAPLLTHAPRALFGMKLALVAAVLARGLLSFIWSIRQLNYALAVIGAAPQAGDSRSKPYAEAASSVLNPALSSFNAGVRGYYFALAATAWLAGPWAFAVAVMAAVGILAWRQALSPAARAVRQARLLLDTPGTGENTPEPTDISPF